MSLADRLSGLITTYSKSVIVLMLLISLFMGVGMAQVDESPGLDQFEFETEEGDALDYIGENFDIEQNETVVQIVLRDQDNALSRESFLSTLDLQEDLRDDPEIDETLAEDPFSDLASIVATQAILSDELEELEAEQDAIENESDALNESADELEADADELEARQEQLEADQAALENRTAILQEALEETVAIQIEAETGERTEAEADAAITETWTGAQNEADLDAEQNATFEAVGADVREVAALEFERDAAIQQGPADITEDPDEQTILRDALNETVELQTAYEEAETDEERADIDEQIEATWQAAIEGATLDAEQEAEFRGLGEQVRDLQAQINDIGPMPVLF